MRTRTYVVTHEEAAYLVLGHLYGEGHIREIVALKDHAEVVVEVVPILRPIWDRLRPRSWRP